MSWISALWIWGLILNVWLLVAWIWLDWRRLKIEKERLEMAYKTHQMLEILHRQMCLHRHVDHGIVDDDAEEENALQ